MNDDVRPFDSGSQMGDWRQRNCHHCAKFNPDVYDGQCEIDLAIGLAYIGSGRVSAEIAERMGAIKFDGHFTWPCPELLALEARAVLPWNA